MAEMKTKATQTSVADFLDAIPNAQMRADCVAVAQIMESATKSKPRMWGPSIVGFGDYKMVYPNGRVLDWMMVAFSPRKQALTLYGLELDEELRANLGSHACGKGCLYIKRLADVNLPALKKLVAASVKRKSAPQAKASPAKKLAGKKTATKRAGLGR